MRIDTPEKVRRVVTNAYPTASTAVISELSSDNIADIGTIITYANYLSEEASYWQRIQEYSDLTDYKHLDKPLQSYQSR